MGSKLGCPWRWSQNCNWLGMWHPVWLLGTGSSILLDHCCWILLDYTSCWFGSGFKWRCSLRPFKPYMAQDRVLDRPSPSKHSFPHSSHFILEGLFWVPSEQKVDKKLDLLSGGICGTPSLDIWEVLPPMRCSSKDWKLFGLGSFWVLKMGWGREKHFICICVLWPWLLCLPTSMLFSCCFITAS